MPSALYKGEIEVCDLQDSEFQWDMEVVMDIVKRLRVDEAAYDADDMDLHQDAADEIERLRDDLKHSDEVRQSALQSLLSAENEIEWFHTRYWISRNINFKVIGINLIFTKNMTYSGDINI